MKKLLLGHYTNLSSLEYILQKRALRFGSFHRTNDPFENTNPDFDIKISDDVTGDSSIFFGDNLLKRPFKLLCFSVSNDLSFFYNRPRMWSQYADDHRGCCLILDKTVFDTAYKSLNIANSKKSKSRLYYDLDQKKGEISSACRHLTSVVSSNEEIDVNGITDFIHDNQRLFLYSKMDDWKEEKEYRYCIYTHAKEDVLIDISGSLREIILGHKVSSMYQRMLYLWGKEKRITISYVFWENGFPTRIELKDTSSQIENDIGTFR